MSADVFMPFHVAVDGMRVGLHVYRVGWSKGPGWLLRIADDVILICDPSGWSCPWTPEQPDVLATDWVVVDPAK